MKTEHEIRKEIIFNEIKTISQFVDIKKTLNFINQKFSERKIYEENEKLFDSIDRELEESLKQDFNSKIKNNLPKHMSFDDFLTGIKQLLSELIVTNLIIQSGEKIYYVSDELSKLLEKTELNIKCKFLKLPFSIFTILFSHPELKLKINDEKYLHAKGAYVISERLEEEQITYIKCLFIPENDKSQIKSRALLYPVGVILKDEVLLKDVYKNILKKYNSEESLRFVKFIFNVLLYLTSRDADIIEQFPKQVQLPKKKLKERTKKRIIARHISKHGSLPYYIVGSKIITPSDDSYNNSDNKYPQRKLMTQHWRSGHWRWHWYGTERLKTRHQKHIWIKPFIVGPDSGDFINKTRVVI